MCFFLEHLFLKITFIITIMVHFYFFFNLSLISFSKSSSWKRDFF
jgi:hypothetical protein